MKRLIVSATALELRGLIELNDAVPGRVLEVGNTDILITGVGQTATAVQLGKLLTTTKYAAAINVGICGCFHRNMIPGTLVKVESDCFADLGAEDGEEWLDVYDLNLAGRNDFPFTDGCLVPEPIPAFRHIQGVKGITVNRTSGKDTTIEKMKKYFQADIETMEGAAFYYSCMMMDVPCIQIRAVSNFIEKRNKDNWGIGKALTALHQELALHFDF